MPHRKTQSESAGLLGHDMVKVLVGPRKKSFTVHRKLLCATSQFFNESLAAMPTKPSPFTGHQQMPPCRAANNRRSGFHDWSLASAAAAATASAAGERHFRSSSVSSLSSPPGSHLDVLWLSEETPEMFELFVLWLYHRRAFAALVDDAVNGILAAEAETGDAETAQVRLRCLHWALVHLHLFAVAVGLPVLQDIAMDAVQDLYLRLDWDVSPRFVRFLYEREPDEAFRLRKWAVAMAAWTLASGSSRGVFCDSDKDDKVAEQFQALLESFPEFCADYAAHMSKMRSSRANPCVKNPQLRIPTNSLRNEERHFGFRMCSFHTHRASVGQGRCPHYRTSGHWSPLLLSPVSSSPSSPLCSSPSSPSSYSYDIVSPVGSQDSFDLPLPSELLPPPPKPSQPSTYLDALRAGRQHLWEPGMQRVSE